MYVLVKNGRVEKYPYSIDTLRQDNPQTSFPASLTKELLEEWDVFEVIETEKPQSDHTKVVSEGQPQMIDGSWRQVWIVSDAPGDLIIERTKERADIVRQKRNQLLNSCDWTRLDDVIVDRELWTIYRQSLRDITLQEGFPWNVDWPTSP